MHRYTWFTVFVIVCFTAGMAFAGEPIDPEKLSKGRTIVELITAFIFSLLAFFAGKKVGSS